MAYNLLNNLDEVLGYLQQCAGFYYLQNPTSWSECFKQLSQSAPKLTELIGGGASAEITHISSAYTSVGKDIYATAESGLKSAPVIESVFTQADQETAVIGESALGTYVAGVSAGVPLATAIVGVLGGLGIGILGYETAPEGWVDISNYIFGTHLTYDDATPLIRQYVNGMFAKDTNTNKVATYLPSSVFERAYEYFANHIEEGGDYEFLTGTTWDAPNPNTRISSCTSGQDLLLNHQIQISHDDIYDMVSLTVTNALQNFLANIPAQDRPEIPAFDYSDIVNSLYSLYPSYNNCNLLRVVFRFSYHNNVLEELALVVDGFRYNFDTGLTEEVDISTQRVLNFSTEGGAYLPSDFRYDLLGWSDNSYFRRPVFSFMRNLITHVDVVKDNGTSYDTNYGLIPAIGSYINSYNTQYGYIGVNACTWNVGAEHMCETFDEETQRKGFIIDPITDPNTNPTSNPKPNHRTNFQDQYAYWYGNKKEVAQPDENGEPQIITYIPTPVPMSVPNPASQVLENGLGVADNPNSIPAYMPNYAPDGLPAPLPANAPVSDPQNNAVNQYNDSKVLPTTAPNPIPDYEPNPQYPENPPSDPNGDSGDTPVPVDIGGITATGMVSVYNPTKQQLIDFSGWLWSGVFDLDTLKKLFTNPMDCIIGMHIMYATPTTGGTDTIKTGNVDSGVSSKVVSQQYSKLNCGTITVPEYYGNAIDYEPYTQVHIYLPFIGIVPLKANDVLGKQLKVEYGIDVLTGTCLAMLTTIKDGANVLCYTYAGNCAVQIPISGGNYANILRGLIGLVGGVGVAVVTANPAIAIGGITGGASSLLSSSVNVQHSGGIGSNAGACGVRKPYLIITRKKSYDAQNYQHYYGFPSNNHVTLGSCKGFTQVKSCHVESIYRATDTEKTEIETLLKQGVIII